MRENQPLSNRSGTTRAVLDGRIDNRKELLDALGLRESGDQPTSAEILLAAYAAWGTACAQKMAGDFAFVIWDSEKQRLFCARDALGVRPFFYAFDGKTFLCGSFIRQLLVDKDVSRELDEEYMANFLVRGDCPSELTPYHGIKRLLGGWAIIIEGSRLKKLKYWDLDPRKTIRYANDAEYEEHFRMVFRDAVSARLRSRGPVAAELSGGLDSSSIVCMAQKIYESGDVPDRGFCVLTRLFDRAVQAKESVFSRQVIEDYKLNVEYMPEEAHWPLQDHHDTALYWDEPTIKGLYTATFKESARRLHRRGARVLLSGIGGDQVFLGDTTVPIHLVDMFRTFHWMTLSRELKAWQKYLNRPMLKMFLENCVKPFRHPNSMLLPAIQEAEPVPNWIEPALARKYDLKRRGARYGFLPRIYRSPAAQRQYLIIKRTSAPLLQWYLPTPRLEARYPYVDRRLVEFAMAIPMEQKLRVRETRSIVRRGMKGILPEIVRTRRSKASFDEATSLGLRKEFDRASQLTSSSCLASLGIVNRERFHAALEAASLGLVQESWLFSAALSLELWLNTLLRGQRVEPTALETAQDNLTTYPPMQSRA